MNETIIIELADRLGTTVEQITNIFISPQQFFGVYTIISIIIFFIIGIVVYKGIMNSITKVTLNDEDSPEGLGFFMMVIYCIVFITISFVLRDAITQIMFPEYSAVQEMILLILRVN